MIISWIVELTSIVSIAIASFLSYKNTRKGARPWFYLGGYVLCVSLVTFTSVKIIKTYARRGTLAGAYSVTRKITQKWDEPHTDYDSYGVLPRGLRVAEEKHAYWIGLTDRSITEKGDHRLALPFADWSRLEIGDRIQVLYNKGDSTPYYPSEDDVMFDYLLLAGELFGAVYLMRRILAAHIRVPDESVGVIHLFK